MKPTSVGHAVERGIGIAVLAFALVAPALVSTPFMSACSFDTILRPALFLGIAAASLIFLSAYGGWFRLQGLDLRHHQHRTQQHGDDGNHKGLNLGWSPWWGVSDRRRDCDRTLAGSAREPEHGHLLLMITLTYAVITNCLLRRDSDPPASAGSAGSRRRSFIGDLNAHPNHLYYAALALAVLVYVGLGPSSEPRSASRCRASATTRCP